jgi:adenylosuccinate lyase
VDTDRMAENLEATRGLVYSQAVLLALIDDQGLSRDQAYGIVQRNGMQAWDDGLQLRDLLAKDDDVTLSADTLAECFSAERHLRNADIVFDRLDTISL